MKLPPIGQKLAINLRDYANNNGYMYANIPLIDGTSVRVMDNGAKVARNPKLPTSISWLRVRDKDQVVLNAGKCVGSPDDAVRYILDKFNEFQKLSKAAEDMFDQMLKQFLEQISEILQRK